MRGTTQKFINGLRSTSEWTVIIEVNKCCDKGGDALPVGLK